MKSSITLASRSVCPSTVPHTGLCGFIAYLVTDPDPLPCVAMADAEKWEEAKDAGAVRRHGAVKRKKVHTANNHKFIARSGIVPCSFLTPSPPHSTPAVSITDQSHVLAIMITCGVRVISELHVRFQSTLVSLHTQTMVRDVRGSFEDSACACLCLGSKDRLWPSLDRYV